MNKKLVNKKVFMVGLILSLILFSQIFAACNSASGSNKQPVKPIQPNYQSSQLIQPDASKMMSTITALSANSRQFGSSNEEKACEYLKSIFTSYGYVPQVQTFNDENTDRNKLLKVHSQNLIAVKKNTAKTSKGIIIICAHYDCEEDSKGANDDASGDAVVLETARLLKNLPNDYEIRFVLFAGEEYHCRGALHYMKNLSDYDKKNIKAVIDIDSIAQKDYVNPRIFTISGKENAATQLLKSASENKTLAVNKAKLEGSDYFVFDYFYKIPALLICQPSTSNLKINGPEDTISLIDKAKLQYAANMVIKALNH